MKSKFDYFILIGQFGFFLFAINLAAKNQCIEYAANMLILSSFIAMCIYGKRKDFIRKRNITYIFLEIIYLAYIIINE